MAMDPLKLEIKAYRDSKGRVAFGAGTPEGVIALETAWPTGTWVDDEDGRPLLLVPGLVLSGPPVELTDAPAGWSRIDAGVEG